MARLTPWDAMVQRAIAGGWDAKVTYATNGEWCSWAFQARHPLTCRRALALWRGRPGEPARFTSACTWGGRPDMVDSRYFGPVSNFELRQVLNGL